MLSVSFYGQAFEGRITASGTTFHAEEMTAAHRTLPFGTRLELVNPQSGKRAVVTITDRGPHIRGRDLDISLAAARILGIQTQGVTVLSVRSVPAR